MIFLFVITWLDVAQFALPTTQTISPWIIEKKTIEKKKKENFLIYLFLH